MSFESDQSDVVQEVAPTPDTRELEMICEAPSHKDTLPDGREVVVIGNPEGDAALNHLQGDNPEGFLGTCGCVSCEDVLKQFGVQVTEADVVEHAVANGECYAGGDPLYGSSPEACGGTSAESQAQILRDYGVPAHVEEHGTQESLAKDVEDGHGVIIEVNAGVLWNDQQYYDNGQANHAITVTGVARDPQTGEVVGYYINDSGTGESGKFVPADVMQQAWVDTGGESVVTDSTRTY